MVLFGACLLMLPFASQERILTPFSDALFTSISAACVTGLVVRDTATYWSLFGQIVILSLIQIGGMGVVTIGMTVVKLSGKKIGLRQRSIMQESISAPSLGGIVQMTGFILKITAIIEGCGILLLMPVFCRDFGFLKGTWYSLWHSVSAFCNAGFDLMGVREPFSSLTSYSGNIYFNIVVMLLIVMGGLSFFTWNDIRINKLHIKKYSMQSKVILMTTGILILLPAIMFFLTEYANLPLGERLCCAFFQSVTARTAGFNTSDLAQMTESGQFIMTVLMLIGGSPGSTAGGMKTTTVAVLFLAALTVFGRRNDVQCFRRRISDDTVRNAGAILFMYVVLFISAGMFLSLHDSIPLVTCLFETGSAVGTAGLTLGITTSLSLPSHIILMILMFLGRVGGLTLIYAALSASDDHVSRLPLEKITVG